MKLYTEEQVRQAYIDGMDFIAVDPTMYEQDANEYITGLIPVELPSDEEIGKGRDMNIPIDEVDMWSERLYFTVGAKWMRDKLTNTKEK